MFDESVHNKLKQKNKIFALCISVLVIAFCAARMIMTRYYIDPIVHLYPNTQSSFVLFFDYIVAACVIAIYAISFFIYKKKRENRTYKEVSDCFVQGTQAQTFSASLTGFLFVSSAVFQIYSFINPGNSGEILEKLKTQPLFIDRFLAYIKLCPFDFLIFFISILCAVYFFKTAAFNLNIEENAAQNELGIKKSDYSTAQIIFSFMPIVWSFLNVFKCFFDMSKSINSPVRIYELVSFLVLSAYFVSESRMLVGRTETSKFFTFAYISVIIVSISSLPNLIWSSFPRSDWVYTPNNEQIVYAVQLAVIIYVFSRIYSQIKYSRFILER